MTKLIPGRPTFERWFGSSPMTSLRGEIDDLLGRFVSNWDGEGVFSSDFTPSLDLSETDDAIHVEMDVPGMKADEIDIEITDGVLYVSGEHKEEKEETKGNGRKYHRVERRSGSFARAVSLPCGVKEDKVKAEYSDGVLTISAPKSKEAKRRKIPVKG